MMTFLPRCAARPSVRSARFEARSCLFLIDQATPVRIVVSYTMFLVLAASGPVVLDSERANIRWDKAI
jgi:hypothetical protein